MKRRMKCDVFGDHKAYAKVILFTRDDSHQPEIEICGPDFWCRVTRRMRVVCRFEPRRRRYTACFKEGYAATADTNPLRNALALGFQGLRVSEHGRSDLSSLSFQSLVGHRWKGSKRVGSVTAGPTI